MSDLRSVREFEEYRPAGVGQRLRATGHGVTVFAVQVDRTLGVEQIRQQAKALLAAADYAEKHGCPLVLAE